MGNNPNKVINCVLKLSSTEYTMEGLIITVLLKLSKISFSPFNLL